MTNKMLKLEKSNSGIYKITLSSPETKNSLDEQMAKEFFNTINEIKSDQKLRVLILTAEGDIFSAGGNIEMLFRKTKISEKENEEIMIKFYNSFLSILDLNVPVIAAINGSAIGAGLCVSLAADIRVAVDSAKFAFNFVLLGLHPGMGATYLLPKLIGIAAANDLLLSGGTIDAKEALKIGLITEIVKKEELDERMETICQKFFKTGPQAVGLLKQTIRKNNFSTLSEALREEARCQAKCFVSNEFLEGITSFKEKREARFIK